MQKRERELMELDLAGKENEEDKEESPLEKGVVEDKRRQFITSFRPHQKVWNFIEEDEESKLPHLLRATAEPNKAYIDGRVEALLTIIEGMGTHLRMYQEKPWDHLNGMTIEIFRHYEDEMEKKMVNYQKHLEEQA